MRIQTIPADATQRSRETAPTTYLSRFNNGLARHGLAEPEDSYEMRHLFVSACLCLMTWSSATDLDPTLPLENFTGIATNKALNKPPENIDAALAPRYEAVALPLAPLRPLLKPIVYRSREEICDTLAEAARSNDLPVPFFIRLLYQESSFRPHAISTAGALGMAQFMPETAGDRGLDNPFDPLQAIPASARLLRDLYQKFGNLGLAAAAYNAGPKRVEDWLASRGKLPQETQNYVKAVTGWQAETWTVAQAGTPAVKLPRHASCQEAAGLLAWNGPDQIPLPPRKPRAKDLLDHERVAQQSRGDNNRISDRRPAVGSGTTTADQTKLLMNVQGNKAYQCELYGISKFCTLR